MRIRDESLSGWPRDPATIQTQLAEYYALVEHLDSQVGRILERLDALGLADDTIVVYAADHGLALGSHGLLGKQSLYEHSMGTPVLLAGPGVPSGRSDALVYLFDLFPTVCGLGGGVGEVGSDMIASRKAELRNLPRKMPSAASVPKVVATIMVAMPTTKLL